MNMERFLWIGMAGLLVSLVPAAGAYWEVPDGKGYDAETHVLPVTVGRALHLDLGPGMAAWLEPSSQFGLLSRPVLMRLDPDHPDEAGQPFRPSQAEGTGYVEVGDGFVVWNDGGRVWAWNADRERLEPVGHDAAQASDPHIEATVAAWASRTGRTGEFNWTIHRADLGDLPPGAVRHPAESWASPFGECAVDVRPVGSWIAIYADPHCWDSDPEQGGIFVFDPATQDLQRLASDYVVTWDVEGQRILWVAYRPGEGRGTNLYLHDLGLGLQRRITWSDGRETGPSLSGDYVAWADVRSERTPQPRYNLYFQNVLTFNEYMVEGTWDVVAGPALFQRHLLYADAEGRLVLARLPGEDRLLEVGVVVEVRQGGDEALLRLTLDANPTVRTVWDADEDGRFEVEGALEVPLEGAPEESGHVLGGATDASERMAVVGFEVREAAAFAQGKPGPALFHTSNVRSETVGAPVPALGGGAALVAWAAAGRARRGRFRP